MNKLNIAIGILGAIFIAALILFFTTEPIYEVLGYIKPATIIQYSGFLIGALLLNKSKNLFIKLESKYLDLLVILGFFVAMASLFEVLWSFFYWFTLFIHLNSPNPVVLDAITVPSQSDIAYKNLSLNSAAKFNILLFFISVYFIYFVHNTKILRLNKIKSKE